MSALFNPGARFRRMNQKIVRFPPKFLALARSHPSGIL